jgi:hypothetical protein
MKQIGDMSRSVKRLYLMGLIMSKYKAHIRYKNSEDRVVPGVTTITGELGWSREALCRWNNRKGLEGVDTKKYVDDKADIGTLAHALITDRLQGKKTNTDDYSKNQIKAANESVKSFDAWVADKVIEPILIETPLVSEVYQYGGTMDIYARVNGVPTLVDLKTGKGVYDEHLVQVGGGYSLLLQEHGQDISRLIILNIPRTKGEKFQEEEIVNRQVCQDIFLNCLGTYKIKKLIRQDMNDDFGKWCKEVSDDGKELKTKVS